MIEVHTWITGLCNCFQATGTITRDDYLTVINPLVKSVVLSLGKLTICSS
jgi:hypothetical protein